MTASRRQFTFGALMLALSGKARASDTPPSKTLALAPRYSARRVGQELLVDLSLVNQGDATEVIHRWGSRLAPGMTAVVRVDGRPTELAQVVDLDRRELVSRMGPRPQFAPLAVDATLDVGTYRFAWVDGLPEGTVQLALTVETADGMVELAAQDVTWKRVET
jgi:hypothetical protein